MSSELQTQCEMVLRHLQTLGSITPIDAIRRYKCLRLSGRIYDLRALGHPIITRTVTRGRKRYASYSLVAQ